MRKKKILFLIRNYVQAGAQRYQYEIIKSLDKKKYKIDIYSPELLGSQKQNGYEKEFYYPLLKKIVNTIFFYTDDETINKKSMKNLFGLFTKNKPDRYVNDHQLNFFFNSYDIINVTEYDYPSIKKKVTDNKNIYIHVMTAKMQTFPKSPYRFFDFNQYFNFVGALNNENAEFEFSEFKNGYNYLQLPLIIDTSLIPLINYQPNNQPYKIGIFTRIDYQQKPLTPYLLALHLLIHRGVNVHLYLFGAGDPSGLNRYIKMFSLENHFFHKEHQEDLGDCLKKHNLNLAWFQGNNHQPAGYSALEIMCRGVPNIFWDFQPLNKNKEQGRDPLPFFWELEKFTNYTEMLLKNKSVAKKLGETQREYVIKNQDAKHFIHILENAFDKN